MDGIDLAPHSTLAGFAAFGHAALKQHVLDPNRAAGVAVDVYCHSWHVEIGAQLDAMYRPKGSLHEKVQAGLNSVRSQHLSMKRGMELALGAPRAPDSRRGRSLRAAEGKGEGEGEGYDLVMVTRYDLLWFSDLRFDGLHIPLASPPRGASRPREPARRARPDGAIWLPHWCHRYPLNAAQGMLIRAACGNYPGHGEGYLVHPATSVGVAPEKRLRQSIGREADFDYAYLDWWFVATPSVAQSFGSIHERYSEYVWGTLVPIWQPSLTQLSTWQVPGGARARGRLPPMVSFLLGPSHQQGASPSPSPSHHINKVPHPHP